MLQNPQTEIVKNSKLIFWSNSKLKFWLNSIFDKTLENLLGGPPQQPVRCSHGSLLQCLCFLFVTWFVRSTELRNVQNRNFLSHDDDEDDSAAAAGGDDDDDDNDNNNNSQLLTQDG